MAIVESSSAAPLVEREDALASLRAAHLDAAAGQGRLVLVSGEAGVGKTTLVRRLCSELPGGTAVLWGGCDPLATPRPLGPFLEIAEAPGFGGTLELLSDPHGVAAAILERVHERDAVVVVEDAHWADEGTLDVLRLLARKVPTTSSLVLVTYRDDELARDHPLRVALGDISTATAVERLAVPPLSRDAVAELADAGGVDVDVDHVWRLTAGNPFYVTELLTQGAAGVPDTVRDLVLARVAQLGPQATAVVEAAAVAPPSLDAELLLAVCGEAADSVDECLASGVLHVVDGGVAFRHELSRTAVEESLSPARRLALHRSVLIALMDAPRERADLARIAHHAAEAADRSAVLRCAPAAAEQAARVGAYREAAAQYARALQFGGELQPGERAELLEGRSRALYLADDQTEAIEVIREAIRCRQAEDAPLQEARALTELADYMWCRGYAGEADKAVDRASELAAGRPEEREHAYVLHTQAIQSLSRNGLAAALDDSHRALEVAERFGDTLIAGHARVTIGSIAARRDLDAGLRELEEAVADARRNGEHEVAARGMNALVYRPMDAGRHDLVERAIEAAIEYCTEHTQDLWRINVQAVAARWSLDRGRWDDAVRHAGAVIDDPRESPWTHHEALCVLALVRARRGDPGARDALIDAAAVRVPEEERFAHVDLAAAGAEIAWLEHRSDDIAAATEPMLSVEASDGAATSRLRFWRRLAGLEAEARADDSDPYDLALSGHWAQAAEVWRERGCPYEVALATSQTGDVAALREAHAQLQRLGARPLATVIARELRGLGVRDLPRGPRAATRANEAALTPRELEVLALIADGLRNADVAERLVVSRRTVDHHVSAILRKLQAGSRGEAVASARRRGLLPT